MYIYDFLVIDTAAPPQQGMSQGFYDKGAKLLSDAVAQDEQQAHAEALRLYKLGLEHIQTGLKYEKNLQTKEAMRKSLEKYVTRAETLHESLHGPLKPPPPGKGAGRPGAPPPSVQKPSGSNNNNGGGGTGPAPGGGGDYGPSEAEINSMFVIESPNVAWEDVIGIDTAKHCIGDSIEKPIRFPQFFQPGGLIEAWNGILLYGPSGTGKTMLARAVASKNKAKMMVISCSRVFKKWVGESEQTIRAIFAAARKATPLCIIFFDEFDSVGGQRNEDSSETSARTVTELLTQMDGIQPDKDSTKPDARVIVIAATNLPWDIDAALKRRFSRRIYIPLPDRTGRLGIFRSYLKHHKEKGGFVSVSDAELELVADSTEGYSSADIKTCCQDVANALLPKLESSTHFQQLPDGRYLPCSPGAPGAIEKTGDVPPEEKMILPAITLRDLMNAIQTTSPSVDPATLERYEEFTRQMGMSGK